MDSRSVEGRTSGERKNEGLKGDQGMDVIKFDPRKRRLALIP